MKMSTDSYFCLCCLSTTDLNSKFGSNNNENFCEMVKDLYYIKLSPEYAEDAYICNTCRDHVRSAVEFKRQVFSVLNVLEKTSLITQQKQGNITIIDKIIDDDSIEDKYKYEIPNTNNEAATEGIEEKVEIKNDIPPTQAKLEIKLEREKRITVNRKNKKTKEGKVELKYTVTADLKCSICSEQLQNVYNYHKHMNKHFPNFVCDVCGRAFINQTKLKRHMPSHDKGPFKCGDCNEEFSNYNTFSSHRQRKHSSVKMYACPHCPERFATFTRRALHLKQRHTESRTPEYSCELCDKTFIVASNLNSHMRNTHNKVRKHICAECGTAFFKRHELVSHVSLHTGLKAHQCALCPKSYPRKQALIIHMRIHNGDRRFACALCDKKFVQKCALQKHLKVHLKDDKGDLGLEKFRVL